MVGPRALVAISSLSVACLSGRWPAAVAAEAAAESTELCPAHVRSGSGSSSCAGVASDIALSREDDGLALLQHGSLQRQQAKPHTIPQSVDLSVEASRAASQTSDETDASEALRRSNAEVASERLWSNRSLLSTRASQQPMVKDVMSAFVNLDSYGHVMRINNGWLFPKGYDKGRMPYSEHFQGIQRQQDQNYLFIPGSGKSENQGQVIVAKLGSRPAAGAMGTNMINQQGEKLDSPPSWDAVVNVMRIDGEFWHAGGMTSYGNYLVVGAEAGCSTTDRLLGGCESKSRIHFYDTSNPQSPKKLPYVIERPTATAGASALTKEKDGRYMLMVGRVDSAILDFYLSDGTSLDTDPGFKLVKTWNKESLLVNAGQDEEFGQYQNLNFVRQTDGMLFMIGTYRTMNGLGSDTVDLYMLDDQLPSSVSIVKVASQHMACQHSTCNFQAGAGVYVNSDQDLILYATNWEPEDGTIYVNEFRGKGQGIGGSCERITPGTCGFFGCSSSRGPTDCVDDTCVCKKGYCHQDGKCVEA